MCALQAKALNYSIKAHAPQDLCLTFIYYTDHKNLPKPCITELIYTYYHSSKCFLSNNYITETVTHKLCNVKEK